MLLEVRVWVVVPVVLVERRAGSALREYTNKQKDGFSKKKKN